MIAECVERLQMFTANLLAVSFGTLRGYTPTPNLGVIRVALECVGQRYESIRLRVLVGRLLALDDGISDVAANCSNDYA